ncbi:MAG TPA: hypothetical protein VI759_08120 [Dehalococcoidia bacterium]|nr:hypothetical protein [Dehalococcoidia bacterium]
MRTSYELERDDPSPKKRGAVIRNAMFYSTLFGGCLALVILALIKIVSGDSGFFFMLTVFGLLGLLFLYFARLYLRDLTKQPVQIEGEVMKKWHKGNLLFFFLSSYYIVVDKKIISIPVQAYGLLLETDLVRVTCYPHSLTVERIELYDTSAKQFLPAVGGTSR